METPSLDSSSIPVHEHDDWADGDCSKCIRLEGQEPWEWGRDEALAARLDEIVEAKQEAEDSHLEAQYEERFEDGLS